MFHSSCAPRLTDSRGAQRVVAAERGLGQPVLHGLLEVGIGLDPLVEIRLELRHVRVAVEAEIAGEVLRARKIDEIEITETVGPLEQRGPHQHVVGAAALGEVGVERAGIEHVEIVGAEALLDGRLGAFGHLLVDVEVAAAGRCQRNAEITDRLAGLALFRQDLPEALDLGRDRRLELVVDAVADAAFRAFGALRRLHDPGTGGEMAATRRRIAGNANR